MQGGATGTVLHNKNSKHVKLKLLVVVFQLLFFFLFVSRGIMFIFINLQVKHSPTLHVFDVGSGGWGECTRSSETQERQEHNRSREPQKFLIRSRPEPDAADTLSLKVGTAVLSV